MEALTWAFSSSFFRPRPLCILWFINHDQVSHPGHTGCTPQWRHVSNVASQLGSSYSIPGWEYACPPRVCVKFLTCIPGLHVQSVTLTKRSDEDLGLVPQWHTEEDGCIQRTNFTVHHHACVSNNISDPDQTKLMSRWFRFVEITGAQTAMPQQDGKKKQRMASSDWAAWCGRW